MKYDDGYIRSSFLLSVIWRYSSLWHREKTLLLVYLFYSQHFMDVYLTTLLCEDRANLYEVSLSAINVNDGGHCAFLVNM